MTEQEALDRATKMAERHFFKRAGVTPRVRQGFVLREQARLLGQPVPGWMDMPKTATVPEPEQDLAALLARSIKQSRR